MKLKQKIGGLFTSAFPGWAASRARARLELQSLAHIRKYVGAELSRISDDLHGCISRGVIKCQTWPAHDDAEEGGYETGEAEKDESTYGDGC